MLEEKVEIINKLGLHARAATKLANTANRFSSKIKVCLDGKEIDAKSIMSLMLLAAAKGTVVTLKVDGRDEDQAMAETKALIDNRFEEDE